MKQFKMLLLSNVVIFFTACGGGVGEVSYDTNNTFPPIGIFNIKSYADDDTQPVPTVEDYTDAGVVGVRVDNIYDINEVVAGLTSGDVGTTEEIQKIVDDLGINILLHLHYYQ